ncbi:CBS domain-containing protein [Streptomyces sp. NPDC003697]
MSRIVGEVMPRKVVHVRPDVPFEDVARLLDRHRISGLPVSTVTTRSFSPCRGRAARSRAAYTPGRHHGVVRHRADQLPRRRCL